MSARELAAPRIETGRAMLLAGLAGRYDDATRDQIPQLWQRFGPYIDRVPGQIGVAAYGVCGHFDAGGFDYMAAVEVAGFIDVPRELKHWTLPRQRYAMFRHEAHVATLCETFDAIYSVWLPSSGHEPAGTHVERYGAEFDPTTGLGGVDVWIALKG
jgi:AraC family transcriptional regulator